MIGLLFRSISCKSFLIVINVMALLLGTARLSAQEKIMPQEVTLQLGKKGPESFKQAGAVADYHTAGELAGFLDFKWPLKQLGVVTIRHSGHDLTIPHTFLPWVRHGLSLRGRG